MALPARVCHLGGSAVLTVPLADALGVLGVAQIMVVATSFAFADAAGFGVVPQMVGRARVASATSTLVSVGTPAGWLARWSTASW